MIEVLYNQQNFTQVQIAAKLNMNQSSLSRKLTRGLRNDTYSARRAERAAKQSMLKRQPRPCMIKGEIKDKVVSLLRRRFSPQQITVVLRKENDIKVSRTSIYGFIKRDDGQHGNLESCLRRGGRRGQRRRRGTNRTGIPNRTDIEERPNIVNNRERYGDWECDLIEGTRHSGFFLTLVERKSRFGILKKLTCKKSALVAENITSALQGFLVHSITYDNGTEFAKHEKVNQSLNCSSYFCKPYASWEKGGVENFNGVVRDFYPKRRLFSDISQKDLDSVSRDINARPKEVLQEQSPSEIVEILRKTRPQFLVDSSQESS